MSAAAAAAEAPSPAPKGKKKLIIIVAAAVLLLSLAGGVTVFMMKRSAAAAAAAAAAAEEGAEDGGEEAAASHAPAKAGAAKHDPKAMPVFVPLDPFTVNLADREAERYAQIGITLEVEDAKVADQMKVYMPAIRNNILMAMADRTAGELMGRDGKIKLGERIKRETSRALGVDVPEEEATDEAEEAKPGKAKADGKPAKKKKKKVATAPLPIKAVHFSNFIIQ